MRNGEARTLSQDLAPFEESQGTLALLKIPAPTQRGLEAGRLAMGSGACARSETRQGRPDRRRASFTRFREANHASFRELQEAAWDRPALTGYLD